MSDECSFHELSAEHCLEELIALSKKQEAGIDCDLYQFAYGINLGFAL